MAIYLTGDYMAECCTCCCGNKECSGSTGATTEGKCCCGSGESRDCCDAGEYCCDGVCQADPCVPPTGACCVYDAVDDCNFSNCYATESDCLAALAALASNPYYCGCRCEEDVDGGICDTGPYEDTKWALYASNFDPDDPGGVSCYEGVTEAECADCLTTGPVELHKVIAWHEDMTCYDGTTLSETDVQCDCLDAKCVFTASGFTGAGTGTWTKTQTCSDHSGSDYAECECETESPSDTITENGQTVEVECVSPNMSGGLSMKRFKKFKEFPMGPGPGTELKALLAKFGIKSSANCSCNAMARKMNKWGAESLDHMDEIIDVMEKHAKSRKIPFLRSIGRQFVKSAVRRWKKKSNNK
mgnify:CR=1 FL=1